jgi:hypothetical protein
MERSQLLNDAEQSLRIALDGHQSGLWTAVPCIVQSVNWTLLTLTAVPAIQGVVTDENGVETFVNLPLLVDVPIMFPAAGGFALTLPIAVGDEVLVVFASRCIDSWWQNGAYNAAQLPPTQPQPPMEVRMHDLSDGFAFPAQMSNPKTASYVGISSSNARLTTADGTCYLEITPGGAINLKAPSGLTVTGALNVTGAITATAEVTAMNAVPAVAVKLSQHVHAGVTSGSASTAVPTPGT